VLKDLDEEEETPGIIIRFQNDRHMGACQESPSVKDIQHDNVNLNTTLYLRLSPIFAKYGRTLSKKDLLDPMDV
jgi:hypothetical protein